MRFPTSHRLTVYKLPLSPPTGGTKRNFAVFASKIQLLSKKSTTKFLCVNSQRKL